MEENLPATGSEPPVESEENSSVRICSNCSRPAMEEDHPTLLCTECREHFTRFPVPLWIKAFAGGIGILLLFSLFTLPGNLGLGIRLERAKRAEEQHKYHTAERELKKVLEKTPDNIEAEGHLLISSFYNQDFETFTDQVKKLEHANVEDKELFARIESVMNKANVYVSNDSFENFFTTRHIPLPQVPDSAWDSYFRNNPQDDYAAITFAGLLFKREKYLRCDSILQTVLSRDRECYPALILEVSVKREEGDLDGAMTCARRLLAINKESAFGQASEVRTLLRQKKDKQALDLALQWYRQQDDENMYMLSTMILAFHFNGRTGDRDELIKKARAQAKDSISIDQMQYALDVIAKKEKFRD